MAPNTDELLNTWSHLYAVAKTGDVQSSTIQNFNATRFNSYDDIFLDGSRTPQTHLSKRRSRKPFSGCSTCKERKIKCDEQRPFCSNCVRSRSYVCRGYRADSSDQANFEELGERNTVDQTLYDVDQRSGGNAASLGAYSMQQIDESYGRHAPDALDLPQNDASLPSTFGTTDPQEDQIEEVAVASVSPVTSPRQLTDGCIPQQSALGRIETDLLKHYRDVVCHYMMPTLDLERNPWLRLYLPLALDKSPTRYQVALRYALMSVAAYNLALTETMSERSYIPKAIECRDAASNMVRNFLADTCAAHDRRDKMALLAAAMTLISTDRFGVEPTDCDIHLDMAKRVAEFCGDRGFWRSSRACSALRNILQCYDIVASTTRLPTHRHDEDFLEAAEDLPNKRQKVHHTAGGASRTLFSSEMQPKDTPAPEDPYILAVSFGVTEKTFDLLRQTINLGAICACSCSLGGLTDVVIDTACDLREQLEALYQKPAVFSADRFTDFSLAHPDTDTDVVHFLRPLPGTASGLSSAVSDEILQSHQESFHAAVMMYFYRVVYGSRFAQEMTAALPAFQASRLGDWAITDCQDYVRTILDCLETIDCLARDTKLQPANTLWPTFIAAVEAVDVDLRHRALRMLAKAAKRGLGNVIRAKRVVLEAWRRTDRLRDAPSANFIVQGLSPVDWRLMMQDKGVYIILT